MKYKNKEKSLVIFAFAFLISLQYLDSKTLINKTLHKKYVLPKETKELIDRSFREQARKDPNVRNAYLLVHSDKLKIHLNIAEGKTGSVKATPEQPNHLASVGKLFTATLIGMLHDQKKLNFDDPISKYLDKEIMKGLHIYKGKDYSSQIKIKHLLQQTSGLNDVFYYLLEEMMKNPETKITTREAIQWGKKNLKPKNKPGKKHFYTDTNYYLLGMIIENTLKMPFYEAMHKKIFEPLRMKHAYMNGFTKPKIKSEHPTAKLYINNKNLLSMKNAHQIDHAGGSVIAPLEEYLLFMKALTNNKLVKKETLQRMIEDDVPRGFPNIGMSYGYSIWKFKKIPFLVPENLTCWGCVGVTGAYMFYHPKTESYIIGSFNDTSYTSKALQFMLLKIIKPLTKTEQK